MLQEIFFFFFSRLIMPNSHLKFNCKAKAEPIISLNCNIFSVLTARPNQPTQYILEGKAIINPQLLSFTNSWSCTVAKCRGFGSSFRIYVFKLFLEILTFSNSFHIFLKGHSTWSLESHGIKL